MYAAALEPQMKVYQDIQNKLNKQYQSRTELIGQQNENKMVKAELEKLEDDGQVYKAVGPVLIKQDREDAKTNVAKRLEYVEDSLKSVNKLVEDLENQMEEQRKVLHAEQVRITEEKQKLAEAEGREGVTA